VYGTVIIGVGAFRGPRLNLGKRSWGLLIRRVISARVRRADEMERASNSASAASSYWDVFRGAGIGSLCMLIASHLERERSNLVEEIVAMEEAPIYYVQAKGAAYWRRCGQPVLSGRAWCSNWKAGLELERLVASICVSWVPVD
jgi:hypothetical protein